MRLTIRDMTLVSLFTALAVAAAVSLRFVSPALVPFSLLPLVVMLAGSLLGPRLAALSMVIYLLMGLMGVPVFQKQPFGGFTYIFQPTFGFTLGFIAGAYIIGKILARRDKPSFLHYFIASAVGLAMIYAVGLPYFYLMLNYYVGKAISVTAALKLFSPYVIFDLGKALVAALIARPVARQVRLALAPDRNPG